MLLLIHMGLTSPDSLTTEDIIIPGDENMTKQHWREKEDYMMMPTERLYRNILVREPLSKREICHHNMCSVNFETFSN